MDMRKQREVASSSKQATPDATPPARRKKFGEPNPYLDGDKIVERELAEVFTNGTIVDGVYLSSDESNHCVAIKVSTMPYWRLTR